MITSTIRNIVKSVIMDKIDDDMIECAIYEAISNMDFSDKISNALEDAVEFRLEDYIDLDTADDIISEVVSDAVRGYFD